MSPDPFTTRHATPRRFVWITRTVHPSGDGYILDAVANDGTAWYYNYYPSISLHKIGWKQHPPLPPIS